MICATCSDPLLIQAGISPACVQKQMGHRSIQVTIDVYGHLIPEENLAWNDTLDTIPQKVAAIDAHQPHTQSREAKEEMPDAAEGIEAEGVIWLPPRDSNPDMLIQSQISHSENKEDKDSHSAKRDKSRQNTHTGRTRKDESGL